MTTHILSKLAAIACLGSVLFGPVMAQTRSPVQKPTLVPRPLPPPPPRPNGASACWADTGVPLWVYAQVTDLPNRSLRDSFSWSMRMTNDQCRATCGAQNKLLAGTEAGAFCFCGDTYATMSAQPAAGTCGSPCMGYQGEICGGPQSNSVSVTTAYFTPVPLPATLPANGWQCVFDMNAGDYRYFEVQRWELTSKDPTTGLYTFAWTTTGGGVYQEGDDPSGTQNFRRWGLTGGAAVTYKLTTISSNMHRNFSRQGANGSGSIRDVQLQFIGGVPQPPAAVTTGAQVDFSLGLDLAPGAPIPTSTPYLVTNYQWHAKPASATTGTINCNWTLVL